MKGGGVRGEGGVGECENSVLPRGDDDTMSSTDKQGNGRSARNSNPSDAMSRGANKPGARVGQGPEQATQPIPFPFSDGLGSNAGQASVLEHPQLATQPTAAAAATPQHASQHAPWFATPYGQFWPPGAGAPGGPTGLPGGAAGPIYPFPYAMQFEGGSGLPTGQQYSFTGDGTAATQQRPRQEEMNGPRPNGTFDFGVQLPESFYQRHPTVVMDPATSSINLQTQATNGKMSPHKTSMGDDRPERLDHEREKSLNKLAGANSVDMGTSRLGFQAVGGKEKKVCCFRHSGIICSYKPPSSLAQET